MNISKLFNKDKLPMYFITAALTLIGYEIYWFVKGIWGLRDLAWWGDVGGLIGGVTAPVTGLLSAILLYLTFQKQQEKLESDTERNKVIRDVERIRERFNDMIELINGVSYSPSAVQGAAESYTGIGAIKEICLRTYPLSLYKQYLLFIFHQPISLKNDINRLSTSNQSFQALLTEETDSLNQIIVLYVKDVIIKTITQANDSEIIAKLQELKKEYP